MLITKILSALIAFIIAIFPFGAEPETEKKCEPKFNGTFIQSWMSSTWDDERWQKEVENMQDAGIEYLILQDIANKSSQSAGGQWTVYYETELDCFENAVKADDVIDMALRNCKDTGVKVFIGLAMFDDFWTQGSMTKQYSDMCAVASEMVKEIYDKYYPVYGDTLYGWYFTPEINNTITCQINIAGQAKGLNAIIKAINQTNEEKPLLLSPFYAEYLAVGSAVTLTNLVKFFHYTNFRDGDIFAVQDAIGAKWVKEENLETTWKMYSKAIESADADIKLWANCENFSLAFADSLIDGIFTRPATENTVSVTETLDRFVWQMDVATKYAENIITFSYNHYYSPDCVNEGFINTYIDYLNNGYVLEKNAPFAPTGFTAQQTDEGVVLTWNEAQDDIGIAYYRIEKNGKFLARLEKYYGWEELTFTDIGEMGEYSIVAVDCAGNFSQKAFAN